MGLVHMWWRQVAGAAGASLIAPLALLLAASAVASVGGLGALGSLRQVASGPSLPDTGLTTASSSSTEALEIVGVDAPRPGRPVPSAPPSSELASATRPAPGSSPAPAAVVRRRETELIPPSPPVAEEPLLADTGEGTVTGEPGGNPPASQIDDLKETTQGLGESLSQPLQPIGNQLVDILVLLGVPRR